MDTAVRRLFAMRRPANPAVSASNVPTATPRASAFCRAFSMAGLFRRKADTAAGSLVSTPASPITSRMVMPCSVANEPVPAVTPATTRLAGIAADSASCGAVLPSDCATTAITARGFVTTARAILPVSFVFSASAISWNPAAVAAVSTSAACARRCWSATNTAVRVAS
ncbi:hypothetical protein 10KY502B_gene0059 [Xanthomonas phage 10KY502B]|nr:hypothetical protein 10KY502B_gene0059 [Xanthomonas phage 10KY502B]